MGQIEFVLLFFVRFIVEGISKTTIMCEKQIIELPTGRPTLEIVSYESHIDSILSANNLDKANYYLSMLNMEVIQLEGHDASFYDFFMGRNICSVPLKQTFTSRESIQTAAELIKHLEASLKKGEYCYLSVDTFFIREYSSSGKNHIVHSPLISGMSKSKVRLSDFFDYKHYHFAWISLESFIEAYLAVQREIYLPLIDKNENWILKVEDLKIDRQFPQIDTRKLFSDYLRGDNKSVTKLDVFHYLNQNLSGICNPKNWLYQKKIVHGLQVYNCIKERIQALSHSEQESLDKKLVAILYKHFCTYSHLSSVLELDTDWLNKSLSKSKQLMYLGLKSMLSKKTSQYAKILELVNELEESEEKYIRENLL
ncbi:hypothetical protein OfM1_13390 [Lactovum odontotermitis]